MSAPTMSEMSIEQLYELYDTLSCFETLDSEAATQIYTDLMLQHRSNVIKAMHHLIVHIVKERYHEL